MIQKIKDGYILDNGTQVMFLTKEQQSQFRKEQSELYNQQQYDIFLERENTSYSLYGIYALQEVGAWTEKWELKSVTFPTYREALEYLKSNNMLESYAYRIVPVEHTLQLSIKHDKK